MSADAPDPAHFLDAVTRIEGSRTFGTSRQARVLIRYLVERVLAGEGERLKGYTIATEALGKPEDFDPASDPSARVAMVRLRKLIAEYYSDEGAGDPHRILLGPGDYAPALAAGRPPEPVAEDPPAPPPSPPAPRVPVPAMRRAGSRRWLWLTLPVGLAAAALFGVLLNRGEPEGPPLRFDGKYGAGMVQRAAATSPVAARPDRAPVLVVMPVTPATAEAAPAADELGQRLRASLARFTEIAVLDGAVTSTGATYRLQSRLGADGRVTGELLDMGAGRIVASFDGRLGEAGPHGDAVRFMVTAMAQPYGLILARERRLLGDPAAPGFSCVLRLFDYWRHYDPRKLPAIAQCLSALVPEGPSTGPVMAAQTLVVLERYRLSTPREPALLEEAYRLARRAVEVTPYDPRVQQALAAVFYARGDARLGVAALRNARRYNPYDPDIAADLATRLIGLGELPEARQLLREACQFVAARPAWMDFYLFLAELLSDNHVGAVDRAQRMTDVEFKLNMVARLIAARLRGDEVAARHESQALVARDPLWAVDPRAVLARALPSSEVVDRVAAMMVGQQRAAPVTDEMLRGARLACLGEPMRQP